MLVEIASLAEKGKYYSIPSVVKSLSFSFNRVRPDEPRRSRLFNGVERTQDEAAREFSGLFTLVTPVLVCNSGAIFPSGVVSHDATGP